MNIWLLLLTSLNILLLAGLMLSLYLRIKEKKEDQRLTKGLQLLQNKISILEDLSDRTDEQVHKLVHLIDKKATELRTQNLTADEKINQINESFTKAQEIAQMLSEQLPQKEIEQRQKTTAYVKVAQLANQGFSNEYISSKIDLSPSEIEMITKVNKDQLQFSEENLPSWIKNSNLTTPKDNDSEFNSFTQAIKEQSLVNPILQNTMPSPLVPQNFEETTVQSLTPKNEKIIRPFEFRKIEINTKF